MCQMKLRNSPTSMTDTRVARRRGLVFVIDELDPRFEACQG